MDAERPRRPESDHPERKLGPMPWLSALKDTARSGLTVERATLEPLVTLRAAAASPWSWR
ncbi:hypothetical protein GCM10020221_11910 [Streptomyces thioluteus]|uniref:Uncharacterized protein n=1 Tax=Streptomyces thioluteus TaxID=66431 RepID=A0ABN3WK80_STRTU